MLVNEAIDRFTEYVAIESIRQFGHFSLLVSFLVSFPCIIPDYSVV